MKMESEVEMTQAEVIEVLKEHGDLTVNELIEHTGMNRSTLRKYISKLMRKHEIEGVPIEGTNNREPRYKYRLMAREGV